MSRYDIVAEAHAAAGVWWVGLIAIILGGGAHAAAGRGGTDTCVAVAVE